MRNCQGDLDMLSGQNNQELLANGLKNEHILFYQSWKEITESKTFDSYQYKSVNVLNGIRELIHDLSSYLQGTTYTTHTLEAMQQELLATVKADYIMNTDFKAVKNRIIQSLSKKYDSDSKLKGLSHQLQSYYSELENRYDSCLTQRLSEAINNGAKDQYNLTSTFISRCVDLGWSVSALFNKIDALKSETTQNNGIDNFLSKIINAKKQAYAIFVPFRLKIIPKDGRTKEEYRENVIQQLESLQVQIKSGTEVIEEFPSIDNEKINKQLTYMKVDAIAHDGFSAVHAAVIELSRVLNILSFFTTIDSWLINDFSAFIAYNIESPYAMQLKATNIYKTYEYLDSSSKVYSRTVHFISQKGHTNHLSQKLLSSFSYSNLSRASLALEEKYMNIWIAVESLCRSDAYDNIIDSIIKLVPNASTLRYTYRKVRNFIEDCNRCQVSFAFSTETIDTRASNKEKLVEDVIAIFRNPTLNSELDNRCKCNSLLHQRYIEISGWLSDPQKLVDMVTKHHQTVTWHLNRLYRIRNEIAHSGTLQEISAVRYTEHLYDYLATIVSEIVRFSESKQIDSLGQIFAIINDNYLEFLDLASAKKPIDRTIALGDFWKTGIISYL